MSDVYAPVISAILSGLGYQTLICSEPVYRDYNSVVPTVMISPINRPDIHWLGFGWRNVKQAYELVYVANNALATNVSGSNDMATFKTNVIINFMGLPTAFAVTGAWNVHVEDVLDYDRFLFRTGYTYSAVRVLVEYLVI